MPAEPDGAGPWTLEPARSAFEARLARWTDERAASRIRGKDPTFWPLAPAAEVPDRLGWLEAPTIGAVVANDLHRFADEVHREGFDRVLLFGMGGSSLAAEVLARTSAPARPGARLEVLDSTHPAAVRAALDRGPLDRTLFLVSSKSGTTLEPNAFFRLFWERVRPLGPDPGRRFVAITDPGTPLEALARERGFRRCFAAPPDVGGRYSALTVFGLVPAALSGIDLEPLLAGARAMAERCADPQTAANPGLRLGAALGELGRAGRDKVVFLPGPALRAFPAWAEQLLAESLGKLGRGLVPIGDPPPLSEFPNGTDAVYVRLSVAGEADPVLDAALQKQGEAGAPVLRFVVPSTAALGAEFFRWEYAVAACGAILEVDPFDQPDVEHAKDLARQAMAHPATGPTEGTTYGTPVDGGLRPAMDRWSAAAADRTYIAVQAFLAPDPDTERALEAIASALRRRFGRPVTVGFGPRFLHSTGQLHKGGPPTGLFLQLVDEPGPDVIVPELGLTFGRIVRAQAAGDRGALEEKHRPVLVVNLGRTTAEGLEAVRRAVATPRG